MRWLPNLSVALLAVVFTCGCGQEEIKVYTIPKEQSAPAQMPPGHPDVGSSPAMPQLKWKLPEGWQEVPAGNMRVASFAVPGKNGKPADVSVIPLPGNARGDLFNVNRWRGQVSQPPVSDTELKKLAQSVQLAGQPAELYEQNNETTRILAAIQHRDGMAWFFKMTGDDQDVAQAKPAFVEFLKSVQFSAGQTMSALPSGHPDISAMPPAGTPSNTGKPQWSPPSDWQEVAGGQFLVAKFTIAGGQAAVNVSSSPGTGGGLAANVNRWRKQLGLDELASDELAKTVKQFNEQTALVEMSGEQAAVVGAIVTWPGQVWFYKLMGETKIVADQRDAFIQFVQGVKY